MKIISIEPTPSPNAMKINLDTVATGMKTYNKDNIQHAPDMFQKLLQIEGVRSIFHTADFISVERISKGDWKVILAQVGEVFGSGVQSSVQQDVANDAYGEVQVYVQVFRGIPMQIRVKTALEEVREALPERFAQAAMVAGMSSPNLITERKLVDWGVRYGEMEEIAEQIKDELEAAYDEERIQALVKQAEAAGEGEVVPIERTKLKPNEVEAKLVSEDWKIRYAALERLEVSEQVIPILEKSLNDDNSSIRRLVAIYLGDIESNKVFPLLFKALEDRSVSVRRTAGDTLSDIGDPVAIQPMIEALKDRNKLVRWRAARFLFEVGDETAVASLRKAVDDNEFEVSLQVQMALQRIEDGEAAAGSVWQQMTRMRTED